MNEPYDLVTVGGGLAGSATAIRMARAGARVLVLEKELAFRDRVRGEFLAPWSLQDVRELGLLDHLLEAGAIPLPALAGRTLKLRPSRTPDGDASLSFSHVAAQDALLRAARSAGAETVRGAKVERVAPSEGSALVHFKTAEGPAAVQARLVVGADGRSSLVRKELGHPERVHRSSRLLAGVRLANVPGDASFGYFVIREDLGALVSLFPQAGGYARAYVFEQHRDRRDFAGPGALERFLGALVANGIPADALRGARQAGPLAAFVTDDSFVDHPAEGPLVLVGDAAGISDPTWGQGVALAFRDVRVLTDVLLDSSDWSSAVEEYGRQRNRYFQTVLTAEDWLTELQLSHGAEAEARRALVMAAWKRDPKRAAGLDLPGRGPALDTSEAARRYVFAED